MNIKNTEGILVFRTGQNKPMKVFIGKDAVTYALSDNTISCLIDRGGVVTKVACDSKSELVVKLSDKATIKIERQRNQVAIYIKADKTIHVITEKNLNKHLTA